MPELGRAALVATLGLALYAVFAGSIAAWKGRRRLAVSARNALIGVQVFASALLLICAAVFLRSAIASARFDPGLRTADTVLIDINSEEKRAAMIQAVTSDATITASAAVRPQLLAPLRVAFADTGAGKTRVAFKAVSGSYFDVLGIPIVRGRAFMPSEGDHHLVAIVSESVARAL